MLRKADALDGVNNFFSGQYEVVSTKTIPEAADVTYGKHGKEVELAMLFIDLKESTKIVGALWRTSSARIYKSFLWGIARIAKDNGGEVRSFNGDGVLVVFVGDYKANSAVKAAMMMKSFCNHILEPKASTYLKDNVKLDGLEFGFGIGIDIGTVLVVKGGIRGDNNNDLVWVGNATNLAVKLSSLAKGHDTKNIYISSDVYKLLDDSRLYNIEGDQKVPMWESRDWTGLDGRRIYRTNYWWRLPD